MILCHDFSVPRVAYLKYYIERDLTLTLNIAIALKALSVSELCRNLFTPTAARR
jgi:hypothetical protein